MNCFQIEDFIEELLDIFIPYCNDKETILQLKEMCSKPANWEKAYNLFSKIRDKTLHADETNNSLLQNQYLFEEAIAKTFYNMADLYVEPGSEQYAPFDKDSPFWVYPIALSFAKELGLEKLVLNGIAIRIGNNILTDSNNPKNLKSVKLDNSFSGALRTFAYFMSSGSHYLLKGVNYLELYGHEPSAIERAYAIFANVIELDNEGKVINAKYAEKRATDYIRSYCEKKFIVDPPFEDWELELY